MDIKAVRKTTKLVVTPEMTRMEAWKAVVAAGHDVSWELFKRIWR
tara:strand:+ start:1059 stop:1193 length:135 start_codon:yes stop_codon:yes gene_type:complete